MIEPDLLHRLRIESDRFARVPVFDKFMLPPEVHARLANLFLEAADEIASHQLFGNPEQLHTLRRQRDEARREIWEKDPRTMLGAREFFAARGWDCFEGKNHNA